MDAQKINEYWMSTDTYLTQEHRDWNAQQINTYLTQLGWTREAIAAIIGNMDVESSVNPALIENRNYHTLLTNQEALVIPSTLGLGLVQWTGNTDTAPAGQKMVSFAMRYGRNWYDGDVQCFRLERECDENLQFDARTVDGVYWDWQTFISSTDDVAILAKVWQVCYERGGTDTELRILKARHYYNLLRAQLPIWLLLAIKKRKDDKRCRKM